MAATVGPRQLISYIALGAPATRRPATGDEPYLRPEIGFTPRWFRKALGIDFGERWHVDPVYRRDCLVAMGREVSRRFGDIPIGCLQKGEQPLDLLTGVFGGCFVAAIYGVPMLFAEDNWPTSVHQYLTDEEVARLEPPDLDSNPFFDAFMEQVEWIARENGRVEGYVNWQGVLNNAYRLRGDALFIDMMFDQPRANHLFECVAATMAEGARRLYARQRETGVEVRHFTISNCLVNMVSPEQYGRLLLPHDRRLAEAFGLIGIHNCAWRADPYLEHYATIPNVGYIDMGFESDLRRSRALFPEARRALMYTPMDLAGKPLQEIGAELDRLASDYGPCDLVLGDIDAETPDVRVLDVVEMCDRLSRESVTG